jgi:hypothetical protein
MAVVFMSFLSVLLPFVTHFERLTMVLILLPRIWDIFHAPPGLAYPVQEITTFQVDEGVNSIHLCILNVSLISQVLLWQSAGVKPP